MKEQKKIDKEDTIEENVVNSIEKQNLFKEEVVQNGIDANNDYTNEYGEEDNEFFATEENIPNVEIEQKKIKKGVPPKKIKVNGEIYYRKKKFFEDNKELNEQDKIMLDKASKIKYKPPLSYRWLKIFGLFALIVPFILLRISVSYPDLGDDLINVVKEIANAIALPLIIFAAFIIILKSKEKGKLLLTYALIAIIIYLMLVLLFERYVVLFLVAGYPDLSYEEVRAMANGFAVSIKIFQYNVFVDLFLCSAFFYFTNAIPKKIAKSKKKMLAFRLCAILPVIYVIISVVLTGLLHNGTISLSAETLGLLTCRSPATYLIFFTLSIYIAYAQKLYVKKGGTIQGFQEYKKTSAHSLMFSIICSSIILVVCLIDFLLGLIPGASLFGIGDSKLMFVIIPFIMLISYAKEYKNNTIDLFLPLAAIACIILLVIDAMFVLMI